MRKIMAVVALFLTLVLVNVAAAAEYWTSLNDRRPAYRTPELYATYSRISEEAFVKEGKTGSPRIGPLNKKIHDLSDQMALRGDMVGIPGGTVLEVLGTSHLNVDYHDGKNHVPWTMVKFKIYGYPDIYYIPTYPHLLGKEFRKISSPPAQNPVKHVVKTSYSEGYSYAVYSTAKFYLHNEKNQEKAVWLYQEAVKAGLIFRIPTGATVSILTTTDNGRLGLIAGKEKPYWITMTDLEKAEE